MSDQVDIGLRIERILNRRVCSNKECKTTYNLKMHPSKVEGICDNCGAKLKQREDDSNEDAIRTRLSIYDEKTRPLVEYYEAKGVVTNQEVSEKINRLGQDVADFLEKLDVDLSIVSFGSGTAPSSLANLFGLYNKEKEMIFSVIQLDESERILDMLEAKFLFDAKYAAIAFTIPLKSATNHSVSEFVK